MTGNLRPIDFFDRGVALAPERLCLQKDRKKYSYQAVQIATWRIASALVDRGITASNRIAVFSPNDADGFVCVLSVLRLGAVWINMNALNTLEENCRYLKKTEAEVLFIHSRFFPLLEKILQHCLSIKLVVGIDKQPSEQATTFEHLLEEGSSEPFVAPPWAEDDICSLFPTGGTTGDPKAVIFTNRMWSTMISTFAECLPAKSPPVHLLIAPMTHGAGGITLCLMAFATTHIILDGFDLDAVMPAIEHHKVTHLFLPPTALYAWLAHRDVRRFNYSSLEYILTGSAPINAERLKEAVEVFGPVIGQTYGQSEAPLICTCFSCEDLFDALQHHPERLNSCGKVTPYTQLEIMDSEGRILDAGQRGQIVIKGGLMTPGYYGNPEATKQLRRNGWHQTGDVGYKDRDGYVYIVDRIKEMIISGGFNIFPAEVESVIMSNSAVQECAVIGVPSDKWGEEVKAIVSLRPGESLSEAELLAYCKGILGAVRAPKSIEFWDELPKSSVGKILKKAIRAEFWQGAGRMV